MTEQEERWIYEAEQNKRVEYSSDWKRQIELEAIRAFVERVEARYPYAEHNAMRAELQAIEEEATK